MYVQCIQLPAAPERPSRSVYPEVTVYYLKDGATQFSPENCNGKTVYQYDIYEAMQNDTAFFEKPQYYGNVLWYEGEKYRYNLLKEQTDYMSDGREYQTEATRVTDLALRWLVGDRLGIFQFIRNPIFCPYKCCSWQFLYFYLSDAWALTSIRT